MPNPYPAKLFDEEIFWRDRYQFFRKKGYILRPRYHPEWQASWRFEVNPILELFEDSIFQWVSGFSHSTYPNSVSVHQKGGLLDATEARENGKNVFIKRVDSRTHPKEVKIASRLGLPEKQKDKRNHCVPILAIFSDDRDPWYQYIVMPVLRPFNEPNFTSFGEVVDYVNQTLEVGILTLSSVSLLNLVFRGSYTYTSRMWHIGECNPRFGCCADHESSSDCAAENILMDGSNLYKGGWHPMNTWLAPDGGVLSLSRKRSEVEIKYYFIDFGLSTEFSPEQRDRLVTGELGRIVAPEQNCGLPYDPFKLDVYYLGYVYQTKIVDVCVSPFFDPI
jgi:serine/threonine protein kinase